MGTNKFIERLTRIWHGRAYIAMAAFFYSCFLEMRNHIGDYNSDLTSNTITSAVVLGKQNAGRILKDRFADVLTICAYLLLMGVV